MGFMQKLVIIVIASLLCSKGTSQHNYREALTKSILFFEGQRSGKLPPTQRMNWRKDSGLQDGFQVDNDDFFPLSYRVDLVGGYYDAGDNIKFNFPMAFTTTMLAWSVIEFGRFMGPDLNHALDAIRWGTDYFLKATKVPGFVFVQVGNPNIDHNCWQRPEDMDEPRIGYAVSQKYPGSEVSAEIAAALAASSIVFRKYHPGYSNLLLQRARMVFDFADKNRGSYSESLGSKVCPFYCDFGGYQDELLWGASWLLEATRLPYYRNYIYQNIDNVQNFAEFGWDTKDAGINVLLSKIHVMNNSPAISDANKFICSVVPESPSVSVHYSKGGLLFRPGGSNLQHATSISFLLLVHASHLYQTKQNVDCGSNIFVSPQRLIELAKSQVDYILGSNPLKMSYMVGYGPKFPLRIHHRGSSLPSIVEHPSHIQCKEGTPYFESNNPNPNALVGAIVGGPDINDSYDDSRVDVAHSEPTTYINAPLVGVLAYFSAYPHQ